MGKYQEFPAGEWNDQSRINLSNTNRPGKLVRRLMPLHTWESEHGRAGAEKWKWVMWKIFRSLKKKMRLGNWWDVKHERENQRWAFLSMDYWEDGGIRRAGTPGTETELPVIPDILLNCYYDVIELMAISLLSFKQFCFWLETQKIRYGIFPGKF